MKTIEFDDRPPNATLLEVVMILAALAMIVLVFASKYHDGTWSDNQGFVHHPIYGTYPEVIACRDGTQLYPGQRCAPEITVINDNQ